MESKTRIFNHKRYVKAACFWDKAEAVQARNYLKKHGHLVRVSAVKRKRSIRHGSKRGYREGTLYTVWKV
jgi:hypothetical protein